MPEQPLDRPPDRSKPPTQIVREAYIRDGCRFWLRRSWANGPRIGIVGLNPSLASGVIDDMTLLRVMQFSNRWGFGSLAMLNLYPFVSPHPRVLWQWRLNNSDAHLQIDNLLATVEQLAECDVFMAAWGAEPIPAPRKWTFRKDLTLYLEAVCLEYRSRAANYERQGFQDARFVR